MGGTMGSGPIEKKLKNIILPHTCNNEHKVNFKFRFLNSQHLQH